MPLVDEFFHRDGRFTQLVPTLPMHKIKKDDELMDTDLFGIRKCPTSYKIEEYKQIYGDEDITGFSQEIMPTPWPL